MICIEKKMEKDIQINTSTNVGTNCEEKLSKIGLKLMSYRDRL